jgi:hypothetical protein
VPVLYVAVAALVFAAVRHVRARGRVSKAPASGVLTLWPCCGHPDYGCLLFTAAYFTATRLRTFRFRTGAIVARYGGLRCPSTYSQGGDRGFESRMRYRSIESEKAPLAGAKPAEGLLSYGHIRRPASNRVVAFDHNDSTAIVSATVRTGMMGTGEGPEAGGASNHRAQGCHSGAGCRSHLARRRLPAIRIGRYRRAEERNLF